MNAIARAAVCLFLFCTLEARGLEPSQAVGAVPQILLPDGSAGVEGDSLLVYRWHSGEWQPARSGIERARGGLLIALNHDCREADRYLVRTSSQTSLPVSLQEGCGQPARVELMAAARVQGRLKKPLGSILPPAGRFQVFTLGFSSGAAVPGEGFPVRVSAAGEWESLIPVAGTSGRLTIPGFTPAFFEASRIEPPKATQLGEIIDCAGKAEPSIRLGRTTRGSRL